METVVILHGLGDSARAWRPVAEKLAGEFRVLAPDLPGHGEAERYDAYGYDMLRDWAEELVAAEGLKRFALVGHSVGGNVAWLLAKKRPDLVSKLVLIEAGAPHHTAFARGPLPEPRHPHRVASPTEYGRILGMSGEEVAAEMVEGEDGLWEPAYDARLFPGLAAEYRDAQSFWAGAERVTMPLLVLRGSQSFGNAAAAEEFAEKVAGACVVVLEGADHFMNRKRPEELAGALEAFLAT